MEAYKVASAKKYTEEDVRKALSEAIKSFGRGETEMFGWKHLQKYLQSLSPKPIAVEVEMEWYGNSQHSGFPMKGMSTDGNWQLKLNGNQVIVKQWIYE